MSQEGEKVYDDDDDYGKDRSNGEMPALRASVGETDARSAESLPKLQTNEMGSAKPVGQGFIYFIETEDAQFVKIGFSKVVINRMGALGTMMPVRLIGFFPGTRETERWLHAKFADEWKTGEWFWSSNRLRQFITMMGLIVPEIRESPPSRLQRDVRIKKNKLIVKTEALPEPEPELNAAAVALGKRSAAGRMKKLSPEQRSEIARKAGLAGGRGRKKT
jgi:hypothetical protein